MTATNRQLVELVISLDRFLGGIDLCFRDDEAYTQILVSKNDNGWELLKKALYGVDFGSDSYGSNLHSLMCDAQHLRKDFQSYLAAVALEQLKKEGQPE